VALWVFSISFEHLYPLFASRELALLQGISESLKHTRLYDASTPLARDCHQLLENAPPRLDFDHRTHLLRVAATVLSDEIKAARAKRCGSLRPDEHIAEVLERLSANDLLTLGVEELAQRFGFCRRHLNRLFHQYFGLSVSSLRMEMRMLKALTLLRDPDAKVVNVAEECGFNHLGLFNASFKQRFGTCPGQWRNQGREPAKRPPASGLNRQLCALKTAGLCPFGKELSRKGKRAGATAKKNDCSGVQRTSKTSTKSRALRQSSARRHP
jgi:AraC-like DNA-binding protein